LNDQPQNGILSIENSTHTTIYFSYEHSDQQVKVFYTAPGRVELTVKSYPSAHGSPNPPYGEHWYDGWDKVTAKVDSPVKETEGSRFRCTGWIGTGAVPQKGTDTFVRLLLNQHSSLTWMWTAQYRLIVKTDPLTLSPQPEVSPADFWYDDGTEVLVRAHAVAGYEFDHWTIDEVEIPSSMNPISIMMDEPHNVTAHYQLGPGNLQVYVKNHENKSIPYATVKSISQPSNQTPLHGTTNRDGYVTFSNVKAGLYDIETSVSGFVTDLELMNVTPGQTTIETVQLFPFKEGKGILKIYVLDSSNRFIIEASVKSVIQPTEQPLLIGTTDIEGRVVFFDILIGSYTIEASKTDYVTNRKSVTLTADRTSTLYIRLFGLNETGSMIIYVKDSDNNPINGAEVTSTLKPSDQNPLSGTTNSTGYVEFVQLIPGSYSMQVLKTSSGYRLAIRDIAVEAQKTVLATIILEWDSVKPLVSVTISPQDPDTTQTVTFSVTANDDEGGSGIASVTLYIDGAPVQTWTTLGTHTYLGGPYSKGNHAYFAVAIDKAGNEAREPPTGTKLFEVIERQSLPLWMWLTAALVISIVLISAASVARRRKKKSNN